VTDALIAARLVHFAAAMALFGGALFALYGPRGTPPRWLLPAAALLTLVSALAWMVPVIANMTGDWTDVTDREVLRSAFLETAFGRLWLARLLLGVVVLALAFLPSFRKTPGGRAGFLILAALLLGSLALSGHAAAHKGVWGDVHRADQVVHLLAAGAWLGGLLPLAMALAAARRSGTAAIAEVAGTVRRFSRIGQWAVGLILATGIMNTAFLVGSPAALFPTPYGQTLLAKIAVVLIMVAIAAINLIRVTPRLKADPKAAGTLWRNTVLELALGLGVLALVGLLGTMIPALYHGE